MIGDRLARLREERSLSLRDFARRLEEAAGHTVSYTTVHKYERSEKVPSDYLVAVAETFDVDALWLLTGQDRAATGPAGHRVGAALRRIRRELENLGSGPDGERPAAETLAGAWRRFRDGQDPRHPLRDAILRSWRRSREAGVDPQRGEIEVSRLPDDELERHRRQSEPLLEAAPAHMRWLSSVVDPVPHVVYLTCPHAVVLHAVGADPETLEAQGLAPGFDWSEEEMGTNGAGTALAEGRPVAVVGPEHYARPLHDFVCCGAPVRGPDGDPVGALDLSTGLEEGSPERLSLVFYAARAISADLHDAPSSGAPVAPTA